MASPAAVAVELIHNFSLLHDDIMDRDVERRHPPDGLGRLRRGAGDPGRQRDDGRGRSRSCSATAHTPQRTIPVAAATPSSALISGQSARPSYFEGDDTDVSIDDILAMEEGKTAALIAGALALGALVGGRRAGRHGRPALRGGAASIGIAFQLVDDVLGIVGDSGGHGQVRVLGRAGRQTQRARRGQPALTSGTGCRVGRARTRCSPSRRKPDHRRRTSRGRPSSSSAAGRSCLGARRGRATAHPRARRARRCRAAERRRCLAAARDRALPRPPGPVSERCE